MAGHYDLRHEQVQRDNARIIARIFLSLPLTSLEVYSRVFLAVALKGFPLQVVKFFLGQRIVMPPSKRLLVSPSA